MRCSNRRIWPFIRQARRVDAVVLLSAIPRLRCRHNSAKLSPAECDATSVFDFPPAGRELPRVCIDSICIVGTFVTVHTIYFPPRGIEHRWNSCFSCMRLLRLITSPACEQIASQVAGGTPLPTVPESSVNTTRNASANRRSANTSNPAFRLRAAVRRLRTNAGRHTEAYDLPLDRNDRWVPPASRRR